MSKTVSSCGGVKLQKPKGVKPTVKKSSPREKTLNDTQTTKKR